MIAIEPCWTGASSSTSGRSASGSSAFDFGARSRASRDFSAGKAPSVTSLDLMPKPLALQFGHMIAAVLRGGGGVEHVDRIGEIALGKAIDRAAIDHLARRIGAERLLQRQHHRRIDGDAVADRGVGRLSGDGEHERAGRADAGKDGE